ncbi:PTS sugar transporter subunit IIA [Clostridioides difficile]|nr:PTS sugar transporter subunit IIA [Clostridioides difficile]
MSLSNKLKERDFIEESSIKSIIDRENISSTEIGNLVAIPHTIVKGDKKSIIGVGILENPIIWDKQEVQLVFMVFLILKKNIISRYLNTFIIL